MRQTMRQDRPIARLQEVFPCELQASRAAYELNMDDNSKVLFIPLRAGGFALQVWRPGTDRCGHGYLLAGSAFLSEPEIDVLIDSLALRGEKGNPRGDEQPSFPAKQQASNN